MSDMHKPEIRIVLIEDDAPLQVPDATHERYEQLCNNLWDGKPIHVVNGDDVERFILPHAISRVTYIPGT